MSVTGKSRHRKLLGPKLPHSSKLLMRAVRDIKSNVLFTALKTIY